MTYLLAREDLEYESLTFRILAEVACRPLWRNGKSVWATQVKNIENTKMVVVQALELPIKLSLKMKTSLYVTYGWSMSKQK